MKADDKMKAETTKQIRTGDSVFHRPSKQKWLVAYADYEQGILAWCGWPPGHARIEDCDLLEQCSDEESHKTLVRLSRMRVDERDGWDHRKSYATEALAKLA